VVGGMWVQVNMYKMLVVSTDFSQFIISFGWQYDTIRTDKSTLIHG